MLSNKPHTHNRCDIVSADAEDSKSRDANTSVAGSKKFGLSAQVASEESLTANANCS